MTTLILSIGTNPRVLNRRIQALEAEGYVVRAAYSVKDALQEFEQGDFDAVLLCSSLSAEEKQLLSRRIRGFGSLVPIMAAAEAEAIAQATNVATFDFSQRPSSADRLNPLAQPSISSVFPVPSFRRSPSPQSATKSLLLLQAS
jgi:DNA-binding response OmpR family regulator